MSVELFKTIPMLVTLNLLATCIFGCCGAVIVFEDVPSGGEIRLGKDHSLSCVVSGIRYESLTWFKDGTQIQIEDVDEKRISIAKSELSIGNLSTLVINNVMQNDAGLYQCVVITPMSESVLSSSPEAELIILSLPAPEYPLCSEPDNAIIAGSTVELTCVSERVYPQVSLQFTRNSEPVNTRKMLTETGNLVTLPFTLKTSKDNNGDIYECHQYSSLDSNYQKLCTMKPLNIQYKPEIKIQHTNPVLPGRETILFCQTFANPPVSYYQWTSVPQLRAENIIVDRTGQVLKLLRPSLSHSGTNITCIATNEIGKVSSSIELQVSHSIGNSETNNNPHESTSNQKSETSAKNIGLSFDVIIIIVAGVVIIVILVVLVPVYHYCLCRNNTTTVNASGEELTQPEVYYESKDGVILRHTIQDRSLPRVPTTEVYGHWRHSTASQVPNDLESHSYTYIDTEND
ncbi:basement membrane-specific heparan sulfate proteoglycan core protein-like [Anneissia japonica]|uniref:basement membrane-specific heparan sulfate proteoglycan core protein-like n=1 Tax=Anneissia japonica TaxID=1529436 RepID=UPI001425A730|nr:basement membrane-specific heparan sulfate proteoglycan core protein-like [Anneissia japonica]